MFITIMKAVGIILFILLIILALLIILPRHFWVEYSKRDGPVVKVNFLFFRIRLYPLPKFISNRKKKPSGGKKEKQSDTESKEKNSIIDEIQFSFNLVQQILSAAKGIMRRVLYAIRFRDVSFTIPLHGRDAYKTQQMYTKVTSAFYTMNTVIEQVFRITYKSPLFVADFGDQYRDSIYFYSQITASPVRLVFAGIYAFRQYKQIMKNNKKDTDKE